MQSRIFSILVVLLAAHALPGEDNTTELSIPLYGRHGEQVKQLQSTSSLTIQFAPGGLVRVDGSYGDLVVEGWDRPEVETSFTKLLSYGFKENKERLEKVRLETKRVSESELSIAAKNGGVALEYTIRVPSRSRLEIHHGVGMVIVSGVTGDINATGHRGDVMIWLPDGGTYTIDARSKFGVIASDFAGSPKLAFYRLGEKFASGDAGPSRQWDAHIRVRMGFGGVTIKRLPRESLAVPK